MLVYQRVWCICNWCNNTWFCLKLRDKYPYTRSVDPLANAQTFSPQKHIWRLPQKSFRVPIFQSPFLGDVGIPQNHVVTRVLGGHTPLSLSPAAGLNHFDHVFCSNHRTNLTRARPSLELWRRCPEIRACRWSTASTILKAWLDCDLTTFKVYQQCGKIPSPSRGLGLGFRYG